MKIDVYSTTELPPAKLAAALSFCGSASKLEAMKVGWIPLAAYRGAHDQGRILVVYNNDDLVGFVMWAQRYDETKIYQIWVRPDARLILHGKALIRELAARTAATRAVVLRLWCAEDLDANLFWRAMGFDYRGWRHGPKRTSKRHHLLWTRSVASILAELSPTRPEATPLESTVMLAAPRLTTNRLLTCQADTSEGRTA